MIRRRRNHSAEYKAHLRSPEWAAIRREALQRAQYRCAFCGLPRDVLRRKGRHLEVHHNTYVNLGRERPEDLTVLCAGRGGCHSVADKQRRLASGRRRPKRKPRSRFVRKARRATFTFGLAFALVSSAPYILPHLK